MDNSSYISSNDNTSKYDVEKEVQKIAKSKITEEEAWADILGDEKPWEKMSSKEKTVRVLLNSAKICAVLGFLYFFICSLDLLSLSFRLIAGKSTGNLMNNEYISNPVVGLMIGILLTVLVQSSSTSTSIIVSMVAAGILNVHVTIPMIMGANIGTSVTNTIVSLTQAGDREQFRRAFAGATVHDMFNWLSVIVILSLELVTGVLEKLTGVIVGKLENKGGFEVKMLSVLTDPFVDLIIQLDKTILTCWGMGFMLEEESMIKKYCEYIEINGTISTPSPIPRLTTTPSSTNTSTVCQNDPKKIGIEDSCHFMFYQTTMSDLTVGLILLGISLLVLCCSLLIIVKILNSMLKGSIAKVIKKVINSDIPYVPFLTGYVAILIGAILTFIVQSSSVFTSTLTPLIGLDIISVERAYPLTLGSNIGTTTTGLLAAMAASGEQLAAIQIALVHLFFNIFGIAIFYPVPFMRWPIPMCKTLGNTTAKYVWFAVFYLIFMFFLLPGSVFALSLGGAAVLWGVLGPVFIILFFVIILNILQRKKPEILPKSLQSWDFLPEPLHSLEPYDKLFSKCICCQKCQGQSTPMEEIVIDSEGSTSISSADSQGITNTNYEVENTEVQTISKDVHNEDTNDTVTNRVYSAYPNQVDIRFASAAPNSHIANIRESDESSRPNTVNHNNLNHRSIEDSSKIGINNLGYSN